MSLLSDLSKELQDELCSVADEIDRASTSRVLDHVDVWADQMQTAALCPQYVAPNSSMPVVRNLTTPQIHDAHRSADSNMKEIARVETNEADTFRAIAPQNASETAAGDSVVTAPDAGEATSFSMSSLWLQLLPLQPGVFQRVIVFDTETTGFGADDEILEIGAIELAVVPPVVADNSPAVCSFETTGTNFHALLRPTRPIHPKAAEVHGLTESKLCDAPPRKIVLQRFLNFVGTGAALVAHNAGFDLRQLRQDLIRCGLGPQFNDLQCRTFCTMEAFRALKPNSSRDLTSVCYFMGIDEGAPGNPWRHVHSALIDAVLTAKVLIAFIRRIAILVGASQHIIAALPTASSIPMPLRLSSLIFTAPTTGTKQEAPARIRHDVSESLGSRLDTAASPVDLMDPSAPKRRRIPWRC